MYKIPPELVINWDQTGINIVPVSQWTMDVEGAKRVEITGIDDKRQITGKLFYNPKQLITLLSLNVSYVIANKHTCLSFANHLFLNTGMLIIFGVN